MSFDLPETLINRSPLSFGFNPNFELFDFNSNWNQGFVIFSTTISIFFKLELPGMFGKYLCRRG
jgi:hypothetical protein